MNVRFYSCLSLLLSLFWKGNQIIVLTFPHECKICDSIKDKSIDSIECMWFFGNSDSDLVCKILQFFFSLNCIWWTHRQCFRLHWNSLDSKKMCHLSKSRMYYTVHVMYTFSMRRAWQLWSRAYIYHSICFIMAHKRHI